VAIGRVGLKKLREALAKAFPSLTPTQVRDLASPPHTTLTFLDGETVIRQGQWAKAFYVITSGEAEVVKYDARGNEQNLEAVLGPGDYFGEIGLLLEPRRTATVRARTVLEVTILDRSQFGDLLEASDAAATSLERIARTRRARKPPRPHKPGGPAES
jgi:CRP/FNR family cyclic AMP-dependent transcriptional regulator